MDTFIITISFYQGEDVLINMSYDEYNKLQKTIFSNVDSNDFFQFDIENGEGEIIIRPMDVKYIRY